MKYTPADGFPYYADLVKDTGFRELFLREDGFHFLDSITEEKTDYRYAPGKWSIKQVVGHITDHERIKMFRAFLLSRNQPVELWGYDQDALVNHSRFEALSMQQLITDLRNVRKASNSFIDTLSAEQLARKAMARQHAITLEDFLKSIIGHELHHLRIIRDKYGIPQNA